MDPLDRIDETYRTCPCGQDCAPEQMSDDTGTAVAWVCPTHGVHTVQRPLNDTPNGS